MPYIVGARHGKRARCRIFVLPGGTRAHPGPVKARTWLMLTEGIGTIDGGGARGFPSKDAAIKAARRLAARCRKDGRTVSVLVRAGSHPHGKARAW